MPMNELEMFLSSWDREAANTVKLLRALPTAQYDFRPDPTGRSLGELAWHLAEGDAHCRGAGTRIRARPSRGRRANPLAHPERSRSHDSVLHGTDDDPRHPVEHDHRARHPPSGPAQSDVPSRGRPGAWSVRSEQGGDGGEAGKSERDHILTSQRRCSWGHPGVRAIPPGLAHSGVSRHQAPSGQTNHEAKLGGEVEVGIVIARAAKHSSAAALLEESDDLVQPVMNVE